MSCIITLHPVSKTMVNIWCPFITNKNSMHIIQYHAIISSSVRFINAILHFIVLNTFSINWLDNILCITVHWAHVWRACLPQLYNSKLGVSVTTPPMRLTKGSLWDKKSVPKSYKMHTIRHRVDSPWSIVLKFVRRFKCVCSTEFDIRHLLPEIYIMHRSPILQ